MMFLAGIFQAVFGMSLWVFDLGGRFATLWPAPFWPWPAAWLHGLLFAYGVFPFFFFGFLLTAGPRWQGHPDTPRQVYLNAFYALAGGWACFDVGLAFPALMPVGLIAALAGWLMVLRFLWRVARVPNPERRHILLVVATLGFGATGLAAMALYALTGNPLWARGAIDIGLWAFLLPMFVIVLHRMLPFFSSGVIRGIGAVRPFWVLWTVLGAALVHGVLDFLGMPEWTWLADLPAAVAALRLTWLWRLRESFAATIVAVLHVSFAWVGVAFALFTAHSLALLAGGGGIGYAPLHALTLGLFSSTAIGMGSRVTLGHSGHPVAGEPTMWRCFWAVQVAAVLRIAGELLHVPGALNLSWLAACVWLGAFGVWAAKYGPLLWRPRGDGRPD